MPKIQVDDELAAMKYILDRFEDLPLNSRRRVLDYVIHRSEEWDTVKPAVLPLEPTQVEAFETT